MMLSRFAENAFWMGRYAERVENLVRLLAVTESFAGGLDDEVAWSPILSANSDAEAFAATGRALTGFNVCRFYLFDLSNPNSAASCVRMLKENARALRHLISTEAWRQVSVFNDLIGEEARRRLAMSRLSEICEDIRIACFTHRGVLEATCYRDEAFLFNRLGAALERADQMTRLIDVKYFRADAESEDAAPVPDVVWWNTLLRSASGYHAFQRSHPVDAGPEEAAAFLLFDRQFSRSVRGAVEAAGGHLRTLERDFKAKPGAGVNEAAAALADRLNTPPAKLSGRALHRFLDQIQSDIIMLANQLRDRYFSPAS
jgi:uncharacterized alpha-E superfamily protein